ncbi:hypothetical protein CDAR_406031 [Caerostris darwini]|uniref:Uncharacterized protein n=1 Tax=Caerostris darwini TaxID=1538125 RepID=A0AAV4TSG1_9ARAC|nr:hypothetical protein CDAR_406031 [Caerostris darwini]
MAFEKRRQLMTDHFACKSPFEFSIGLCVLYTSYLEIGMKFMFPYSIMKEAYSTSRLHAFPGVKYSISSLERTFIFPKDIKFCQTIRVFPSSAKCGLDSPDHPLDCVNFTRAEANPFLDVHWG